MRKGWALVAVLALLGAGRVEARAGWFAGLMCFLEGGSCTADHVWKYHEPVVFALPDGRFYFLVNVERDFLVAHFRREAAIRGIWDETLRTVEVQDVVLRKGDRWMAVLGREFTPPPLERGLYRPRKRPSRELSVKGTISGWSCFRNNMVCDRDHLLKQTEYVGLYTDKGMWYHLAGLPERVKHLLFTRRVEITGRFYPEANLLKVSVIRTPAGEVLYEAKTEKR